MKDDSRNAPYIENLIEEYVTNYDYVAQILIKVGNHERLHCWNVYVICEKLKALVLLADTFGLTIVCICPLMTATFIGCMLHGLSRGKRELFGLKKMTLANLAGTLIFSSLIVSTKAQHYAFLHRAMYGYSVKKYNCLCQP